MEHSVSVAITLTADELRIIEAAAKSLDVSVSDYVRGLVLPDARALSGNLSSDAHSKRFECPPRSDNSAKHR